MRAYVKLAKYLVRRGLFYNKLFDIRKESNRTNNKFGYLVNRNKLKHINQEFRNIECYHRANICQRARN